MDWGPFIFSFAMFVAGVGISYAFYGDAIAKANCIAAGCDEKISKGLANMAEFLDKATAAVNAHLPKKPSAQKQLACSFCGKRNDEVEKLIAGPTVFICSECVELCVEIVEEERSLASADNAANLHINAYGKEPL